MKYFKVEGYFWGTFDQWEDCFFSFSSNEKWAEVVEWCKEMDWPAPVEITEEEARG